MTIQEYFGDWSSVIDLREADGIMRKLSASNDICPTLENVFKAFRLCPLHNLRVLICGQDPYPNLTVQESSPFLKVPVATGLAFANAPTTKTLSPSLEVLRESVIDFTRPHEMINFDPSLEKWEEQGVLLLNAALTCKTGRVGSHTLLWWPFMTSLFSNLSKYTTGIVYVLMGNQAQNLEPFIDKRFNHVIRIRHPSWYARNKAIMPSDLWKNINDILIGQNGYGIKWCKMV